MSVPPVEIDVGVVVPGEPDVLDDCGAVCGPAVVAGRPVDTRPDVCLGGTTRWSLQPCEVEPVTYPPQEPVYPPQEPVGPASVVSVVSVGTLPATGSDGTVTDSVVSGGGVLVVAGLLAVMVSRRQTPGGRV